MRQGNLASVADPAQIGAMIEIDNIVDRDSLKAWLTDWPRRNGLDAVAAQSLAATIAHRAAMRVLPVWWEWTFTAAAREFDLKVLPELRCVLVSGVAGAMPSPETKRAAAAAATDAATSDATSSVTFATATFATFATAASAASAATTAAAASAAASAASAVFSAAAWKSITEDCRVLAIGDPLDVVPLWPDQNPFEQVWRNLRTKLPDGWEFWRDWYQAALDGRPPNWQKLEKIALIPNKIWDAGPAALNQEIARIEIDFAVAATPNAAEIDTKPTVIQQSVGRNLQAIPPQIEAIAEVLEKEIERLRGKNPKDEIEADERDAQIKVLKNVLGAVADLGKLLPDAGVPPLEDAKKMKGLLQVYADEFKKWPRENAGDLVDSSFRLTLVGLTAGLGVAFGLPALAGVALGGVAFGGKKLVGAAKSLKDNMGE